MSRYQHEDLATLQKRTWKVSALSSALRELLEDREIEDDGPVLGVIETLEHDAGEINEIINAMINGGSMLEVRI
ncbi:hypothetical protein [Acidisoma silvae]|uniref:Uncharacterized protein n=1 Tax=Acidisoma silvae TaxID=2802396 RepID=A0A964E1C2_9PROT|nr:hypothetical protein [Acidisoma silvae]MCB8877608.1 hypothetical protein [Acidisoma silvae]